jgi:7-carboxy-7-deazaguanine synthase
VSYAVKECFLTLQGEGARTGRAAVFCRLAGCNLWSGRQEDRAAAACAFCDTDFVGTDGPGGGTYPSSTALADAIEQLWRRGVERSGVPYVVFTGGEPLLQLDAPLVAACHARGFEVAIETNGTIQCPAGVDWICVSPKSLDRLVQRSGQELKLVFPQPLLMPELFEQMSFEYFFLQPMDGPARGENTLACVEYCLAHPKWRLSTQTHKHLGIP